MNQADVKRRAAGAAMRVRILKLRAEGLMMKEIASDLNISERVALYHWGLIKGITGLRDVALLTQFALRHGIAEWRVEV